MRVAIIGSRGFPYVYSGYETFVSELATRLAKRGHNPVVYCHRGLFRSRPRIMNEVELVYAPAIEHKNLSQFSHSFLSTLHVLFRKVDVVFYVNPANGPFGFLTTIFGKRTAINVDGLEWLRPKWKGLGARYFRFASYLATKWFDVVVTDSERMAEIYKREFDSQSVTIAYGADIGSSTQPHLLRSLDLSPRSYYLVVGRLVPDNNADLIVRGFESSASTRKLVILGDVPYRDRYVESVRSTKDPRVLFPGYVRDQDLLRELYCNSYAYIHGHEFGGTNPALLKALGYGCCVLALDTPFNREVLADDVHGFYFTKTELSVQQTVQFVERNEGSVKSKREGARLRIVEKYTWEKITDQYEALFRSMIDPR
jgi:glycosyltransferase involved in cell wall biosynthesis